MRKPIVTIVLLVYMVCYIIIVATMSSVLAQMPKAAQLIFYVIAGFIWIIPLRPLFRWMNANDTPRED